MSAKTFIIIHLARTPQSGEVDEVILKNGVNLIVGEKDTGKTTWLRMLDYLMGDDAQPREAFGEEVATKYETIRATIEVDTERMVLERRWKESGARTKVFVNGEAVPVTEFSQFVLKRLNIPVTYFPKGSPFAERAWPELSWRMLYRHIYRQERFWNDFADKQPEVEQTACLLQFMGAAQAVYPPKYGDLVQRQKDLEKLQGEKEAYSALLHSITTELLQQKEITVAVTEDAVLATEQRLQRETQEIMARRKQVLEEVDKQTQLETGSRYEKAKSELLRLDAEREEFQRQHEKLQARIAQLADYASTVTVELEKMDRMKISVAVIADLKVTQCPVCDRDLEPTTTEAGVCYLCGRNYPISGSAETGVKRVSFEEEQLKEEREELNEVLLKLKAEADIQVSRLAEMENERRRLNAELGPARQLIAKMIPPDLSILDQESGRIQEKLEQLRRVRKALDIQKSLSMRIEEIQIAEAALQKDVGQATPSVNLNELGDLIQDRMNQYLNMINEDDPLRWQHGPIGFVLREREFTVRVKGGRWNTQVGATSQALVLFAYHYALLSFAGDEKYNYPGLVIIDFPMQLADGTSVAEAENYLVKPFIELSNRAGMERTQFIAAGRAFANLPGSHQIHLRTIW